MTTKLLAELKDFSVELDDNDEVIAYRFRYGKIEDWQETHERFKKEIPVPLRKPFPDKNWLWRIEATPETERTLGKIFDNFAYSLEQANSQLRMFK